MYETEDRGWNEEALWGREEFLRRLFESSHDCIKVLDLDGRLLSMSPGGLRLMEIRDLTPYLNTLWIEFWTGVDREAAKTAVEEASRGMVNRFQGYCPTVTGRPKWWSVIVTPIHDREGRPEKLLSLARDITDQKLAEDKLQRTVEKLEGVLAGITDAYMALDRDWRFVEVNRVAEKVLGRPAEALVGKVIWDEFPQTKGSHSQEQYQIAMAEGHPVHFETKSSLADAWFEVHAYPHGDRLDVYWRNITERKRIEEALRGSEERLRVAQDKAKLRVWDWNRKTGEVHFSLAPSRVYGLPQGTTVSYEDLRRRVHPEDIEKAEAEREEAIARHQPFDVEYRVFLDTGQMHWIASRGGAIYDEAGEVVRVLGINLDITERKRTEEALKTAKQAAESASRAKDHFMAVLSHELRTPLTPVLAAVSMLQEDPGLDQEKRESLEMIRRNVELEARFIDDLLDLTRVTRGKVDLDRRPTELWKVVRRAVEVCMPDLEARKLRFGMVIKDAPHFVNADAGRLQQVFWNLLKNGIKFTPPGGCLEIRCWADEPMTATVEVRDTGIGIAPEMLGRIFNPFEQAEPTIHRRFGGLGLGLTISKAMVEMHGGTIEAFSAGKDQGATFRVRLPRILGPHGAPEMPAARGGPAAAGTQGLRILLVEDHGDTARIMSRLLASTGNDVRTAGDVALALDLAGKEKFDLLISDLGLPDGSGYELLRRLREKGGRMPAIALSGYGQEQDVRQSILAGFSAHLVKPTDFQKLRETIAAIMGSHG